MGKDDGRFVGMGMGAFVGRVGRKVGCGVGALGTVGN